MSPERGGAQARVHVDSETRLYAVLGHPVAHSLSPVMQNAAFQSAGRNAAYVALDVPPHRLEEALTGLHAAGFAGLNVTLPHKEQALRLARAATPGARATGAANTLKRVEGGWEAEATDGMGLLAWLASLGLQAPGSRVLVIGAGGAGRSVAAALAQGGAGSIRITNRSPGRAEAVAGMARKIAAEGVRVDAAPWGGAPREAGDDGARSRFDVVVRAVSSESVEEEERAWWEAARPGGVVLDLNYGDRARPAREEAARMDLRYEDGVALLVEQGALSYEFWTGEPAPREAMRAALA